MKFELKANLTFEAKSVDDALHILSVHFGVMSLRALKLGDASTPSPLQKADMLGELSVGKVE